MTFSEALILYLIALAILATVLVITFIVVRHYFPNFDARIRIHKQRRKDLA